MIMIGSLVRLVSTGDEGHVIGHVFKERWDIWFDHCIEGTGVYATSYPESALEEIDVYSLPETVYKH